MKWLIAIIGALLLLNLFKKRSASTVSASGFQDAFITNPLPGTAGMFADVTEGSATLQPWLYTPATFDVLPRDLANAGVAPSEGSLGIIDDAGLLNVINLGLPGASGVGVSGGPGMFGGEINGPDPNGVW